MIYHIDIQRFLLYAIDYFSFIDLNYIDYVVISSTVMCGSADLKCHKASDLYPMPAMVVRYAESKDASQLEYEMFQMYDEMLKGNLPRVFYDTFIYPMRNHFNVFLICDEGENIYLEILSKYVKKKFGIEVINLNKLFTKGKLDPVHYDLDTVKRRSKEVKKASERVVNESMASTREGREKLLKQWNKKQKLEACKRLGIRVRKNLREEDITTILMDVWVGDED